MLDPKNGTAPGFDRGFDRYDAGYRLRRPGENRYQTVERRGADVVARALAWRRRRALAPYDGEIAEVDRLAASLVAAAPPTTVVVFLYEETLHVPLVDRLPGRQGAGARVATRVRLADVAPTILEAAGVVVPPQIEGKSLLPVVDGGEAGRAGQAGQEGRAHDLDRPVYSETAYPRQAFGGGARSRRGVRIDFCS